MKLTKYFIDLSLYGGFLALVLRGFNVSWWDRLGMLSFAFFFLSGVLWISLSLSRNEYRLKVKGPLMVFFDLCYIFLGVLGFIYTLVANDSRFSPDLLVRGVNVLQWWFVIVGAVVELIILGVYIDSIRDEIRYKNQIA